jgi:cbb3-type cytochrome oxidase subunit 1
VKGRTKVSVLTPSKQMQKSIRYHTAITLTMRPVLRFNFLTTLTTEYHIRREVSITKFVVLPVIFYSISCEILSCKSP